MKQKVKKIKDMREKRITLPYWLVSHLYEMAMEHLCVQWKSCATCEIIRERLDKFLGEKEVRWIKRIIRKNGYCNKLKPKPRTYTPQTKVKRK